MRNSAPHQLAVWRLADEGWRDVVRQRSSDLRDERNRRLNTPESSNIDELFKRALGIERSSTNWATAKHSAPKSASELDTFIELRNVIAHRGAGDAETPRRAVKNFINLVHELAVPTEATVEVLLSRAIGRSTWTASASERGGA